MNQRREHVKGADLHRAAGRRDLAKGGGQWAGVPAVHPEHEHDHDRAFVNDMAALVDGRGAAPGACPRLGQT